jgi:hypothetical protein
MVFTIVATIAVFREGDDVGEGGAEAQVRREAMFSGSQ